MGSRASGSTQGRLPAACRGTHDGSSKPEARHGTANAGTAAYPLFNAGTANGQYNRVNPLRDSTLQGLEAADPATARLGTKKAPPKWSFQS